MARGAYLSDLGNTPGHLNHWSKRGVRAAAVALRRGRRGALAVPVDDAACPASERLSARAADDATPGDRRSAAATRRLRPRRAHPVHRDRVDRALHVRLLRGRHPRAATRRLRRSISTAVVGAVRRHLGHLPAGRAAAVADDRRRAGARASARHPLRTPALIQLASRRRSSSWRWRCAGRSRTSCSTARRRCTGSSSSATLAYARQLLRPRLVRRPPVVRPLRRAGAVRVGSRFCFPLAVAVGIACGPDRGGAGHRRRAGRLAARRAAGRSRRGEAPATRAAAEARRLREGGGFAARRSPAIQLAEQTLLNAAVLIADVAARTPRCRRRLQRAADRARAAAALPGVQTSLLPHLAGRRRPRAPRPRARDPRDGPGDRGVRRRGGGRRCCRSGRGSMDVAVRRGLRLRPRRPGAARRRHGLPPRRRARSTRPRSPAAARPRPPRAGCVVRRRASSSGCSLPRRSTTGSCAPRSATRLAAALLAAIALAPTVAAPLTRRATRRPAPRARRAAPRAGRAARRQHAGERRRGPAATISCRPGWTSVKSSIARLTRSARITPSTTPRIAADQRGDHRLVADHPPHLAARGADRAQHAELARALGDREHERVDDAEQRDDDRQRQQRVDQRRAAGRSGRPGRR